MKNCVVVVICNLIQAGAEAGEEGANSLEVGGFVYHTEVPNLQ